MTSLGIREYAILKNEELVARGVHSADATASRERFTGHRVRIGPLWARTIGCWGGIKTLHEIAEFVDRPSAYVKTYARTRGLKYRTRNLQRTPAQLAVMAFASLPAPARDARTFLGLYPAEICLYRAAMMELLTQVEVRFIDVLAWPTTELERAWSSASLSIASVQQAPALGDIAELVRRAEDLHRRGGL